jgi:hypothetical protein
MKKIITLILLLTTLQTINAQEPRGYSVIVGTNIANLKTTDLVASSVGPGYFLGIGFNWGYNERFNYQFEFAATQNAINLEGSNPYDITLNKYKVDFGGIQTGFYFNYYILKPEEDKFYFGTQLGLNATFGGSQDPNGDAFNSLTLYKPSGLSGVDISNTPNFLGGVSLGLTGAYNKFRFNLRYNLGFSNLLSNATTVVEPGAYSSGDTPYSAKLSSIGFTVSYRVLTKN